MKNATSVILILFLLSNCVGIQESRRIVDRPVREYTTQQVTSGWKHEAKVTVYDDNMTDSFRVYTTISRHKDCIITSHAVVDRAEKIERFGPDMKKWYLISGGLALSASGAAVAASTLDQMRENRDEYLATTALVSAAAIGLLIYAIVNDVRAADSTNHIGEITLNTPHKTTCKEEPAPGALVELKTASGDFLLSGVSNIRGVFEGSVEPGTILRLGPDYRIHVAGVEIGTTKALISVYADLIEQWEVKEKELALVEQKRERGKQRQEAAKRAEQELAEEIGLRSEANRIQQAKGAVKVWDVSLLHKPDRLNSKVFLNFSFENRTYKTVIGVTTHVRILNPFGRAALTRMLENEVKLPAREGIAESVRIESDSAWIFEELSMSPDYRRLWKIAENGTAKIMIKVVKVIFEDRSVLK